MELTSLLIATLLLSSKGALPPAIQQEPLFVAKAMKKTKRVLLKTYRNEELGFSINYPKDWKAEQTTGGLGLSSSSTAVAFAPPTASEGVGNFAIASVTVEEGSTDPLTLEEYTKALIAHLKETAPNFHLLTSHEATLAKQPAHAITFTIKDDQLGLLKAQVVWTVARDTAYVVTTGAHTSTYPKLRAVFLRMVKSFALLD